MKGTKTINGSIKEIRVAFALMLNKPIPLVFVKKFPFDRKS